MKLIILRTNLIEALNVVQGGIGENANLPILKSFLVRTDGGRITFVSTNLELAVECVVPGKVVENGKAAIPFSIFNSIVKNLTSERVTIGDGGNKATITTDNYEAVVQGWDPNDFPIIPSLAEENEIFKIKTKELKDAVSSVISSAQYSEIRPEISGILLSVGGDAINLVATDGFRLAEKTVTDFEYNGAASNVAVIIPLRTANEFLRIFNSAETVDVFLDQNQVLMRSDKERVISRLIDGKFPDYKAVIPKETKTEVIADRQELINAVKIASSFSGKSNDITIHIGDNKKFLEVYSADTAIGENNYKVPVKLSGDKFSVIFNWRYVLDGLKVYKTPNVSIGFNSPDKPVIIRGEGDKTVVYVAMPIKG
jgi:DNA polymerase-3 subunit beta